MPAELGADRARFTGACGLKAYAGSSPITRASGRKSSITRRRVKNQRLNQASFLWAISALRSSPGVTARYRYRRDTRGELARLRTTQRLQPPHRPAPPLPAPPAAL
ncbi:transposase [Streptomyces sp. NPDC033753]|uniref:transposase n=1 Tax=Streptomyces sp. NPDC033753 TaxID=3155128 RepID=UPI0033C14A4C